MSRKAASFLGSAGASLVDLDSLLSSNAKPKQTPLSTLTPQTRPAGALTMTPMAGGPMGRTMSSTGMSPSPTPPIFSSLFDSNSLPTHSVHQSKYGPPGSTQGTSIYQLPSHSLGMSQPGPTMPTLRPWEAAPYLGSGMVWPTSMGGIPPLGHNIFPSCAGAGMVQSGPMGGTPLIAPQGAPPYFGVGMAQPNSVVRKPQAGVVQLGGTTPLASGGVPLQSPLFTGTGSGETNQGNSNPFLF